MEKLIQRTRREKATAIDTEVVLERDLDRNVGLTVGEEKEAVMNVRPEGDLTVVTDIHEVGIDNIAGVKNQGHPMIDIPEDGILEVHLMRIGNTLDGRDLEKNQLKIDMNGTRGGRRNISGQKLIRQSY